jgi:hypothetical protein
LPGAEITSHGLRLRAEGDRDPRGRLRIGTVLVRRATGDDTGDDTGDGIGDDGAEDGRAGGATDGAADGPNGD